MTDVAAGAEKARAGHKQAAAETVATIEIRISSLVQLFDPLDPAPLQARALDHNVERYILAAAGTRRPAGPLRLVVHLPESLRPHAADATDAIHAHFRRMHEQGERTFRRRFRIGVRTLAIALGVLAGSLWLRSQLTNIEGRTLAQGLGEGLLILGWVAMWRPVEILLFEHWESHLDHAVVDRLASIPIECQFQPEGAFTELVRGT